MAPSYMETLFYWPRRLVDDHVQKFVTKSNLDIGLARRDEGY